MNTDISSYKEKLKNPKWQKKRLEILNRDGWTCQRCFDTETTLVVHHKRYLPNKEPWDYPDNLLITLCEKCHELEREERPFYEEILLDTLHDYFWAHELEELAQGFFYMFDNQKPYKVSELTKRIKAIIERRVLIRAALAMKGRITCPKD